MPNRLSKSYYKPDIKHIWPTSKASKRFKTAPLIIISILVLSQLEPIKAGKGSCTVTYKV